MYARVFDSILGSTINEAEVSIRWAWITVLVLKDKEGFISGTPQHLARQANLPLETMKQALDLFMSPDPNSTSQECEGRRLQQVAPNKYHVVNHEKYEQITKQADRNEQARLGMAKLRAAEKVNTQNPVNTCYQSLAGVTKSLPLTVAIPVTENISKVRKGSEADPDINKRGEGDSGDDPNAEYDRALAVWNTLLKAFDEESCGYINKAIRPVRVKGQTLILRGHPDNPAWKTWGPLIERCATTDLKQYKVYRVELEQG